MIIILCNNYLPHRNVVVSSQQNSQENHKTIYAKNSLKDMNASKYLRYCDLEK